MGVISIEWFKSYLSGRQQVVTIDGTTSCPGLVTCGVPQGSILGPLLFLCYVNDMVTSVSAGCKLILYADDSAIMFAHKNHEVISQKLSNVMESCSNWLVDNKLSLHLGKTECVLFGPRRKLRSITNFHVHCKDHIIKAQDSVRYLGLFIDNQMNCEKIVNSIIGKVNSRLKCLYRHAKYLNISTRITLSSALIQCYFDYSSSSWFGGLSKALKHKLQVTQNKVVRFILNLQPMTSINYSVLSKINMLNVEDRAKQLRLYHVFNIYHDYAPQYLHQNFIKVSDSHVYNTRGSTYDFTVPAIKSCESESFYYNAILDWNNLPNNLKLISNRESFKRSIKRHLLTAGQSQETDIFYYF